MQFGLIRVCAYLHTVQPNQKLDVDSDECPLCIEKLDRLCEYTLISFKNQSIRSKVQCTDETFHNNS